MKLTVKDLSVDQKVAYDAVKTWLDRGTATKQIMSLGGYGGCLAGETIVRYNRGARLSFREITLRDMYMKFNGMTVPGVRGSSCRWSDLTLPTYMLSLWPDGNVEGNRVVAVYASGVKPLLKVTLKDGTKIRLTGEHPVATPGAEFVQAKDLSKGDVVLLKGALLAKDGKGRDLSARPPRVIVNTKHHPGPTKTVWCNGIAYDYVRVARARLVVEAALNDVPYDEFVHALKKNAGLSAQFKYLEPGLEVHHQDHDTMNDDIENLMVLPAREHARIHGPESKKGFHKEMTRETKITRIERDADEDTYDVQMESPANNFMANNVIVHNSGKSTVVSVLAHELPSPLAFCAFTGKASSVLRRKLRESGIMTTSKAVKRDEDGEIAFEPRPYCGTIHGLVYRPCETCMEDPAPREHTYGKGCDEKWSDVTEEDPPGVRCAKCGGRDGRVLTTCSDGHDHDFSALDRMCEGCNPPPPKASGPCAKCDNRRFFRRQQLDRPYELIVVDEASMVSDEILDALRAFGTPILAVGDHGQLPPIKGQGSLMKHPDVRLEKIHRVAEGNPIILLSARIRETGDIDDDLEDGDAITILSDRKLRSWVGERFPAGRLKEDPYTPAGVLGTTLVTWTNKQRVSLNRDIRESLGLEDQPPTRGDVVICLKNKPPVYNGMRAVLLEDSRPVAPASKTPKVAARLDFVEDGVRPQEATMMSAHQFYEDKTIDYDKVKEMGVSYSQLGELYDFGYALTAHKLQGSSSYEVGVYIEPGLMRVMGRDDRTRWMYTAVTRSEKKLVIFR